MGGKATYLMINPSPSSLTWRSCFTHSSCPLWSVPNKTEKFNKIFETSTESVSPSHGPFEAEAADLYVLKSLLTVLDSKSVSHTVQIQSRHPAKYARHSRMCFRSSHSGRSFPACKTETRRKKLRGFVHSREFNVTRSFNRHPIVWLKFSTWSRNSHLPCVWMGRADCELFNLRAITLTVNIYHYYFFLWYCILVHLLLI